MSEENMKVVKNNYENARFIAKGPKYMYCEPQSINWKYNIKLFMDCKGLYQKIDKMRKQEGWYPFRIG